MKHASRSLAAWLALGVLAVGSACDPATPPPAATTRPTSAPSATPGGTAAQPTATTAPSPTQKVADPRASNPVAEFYRGRTIKIVVGYEAGGGFDSYARMIARQFGKYIPGNPTVIVENLPGAASLLAANQVYHAGAKDGTTIVSFHGGMITQQLFGSSAVEFDAQKFQWLGAPATSGASVCAVSSASGVASLEQARGPNGKQLVFGGLGAGSRTDDIPTILRDVIGLNVKLAPGYKGTADLRLGVERGELTGSCWGWDELKAKWGDRVASGEVKVIGQGGKHPHPDLPNVPLMRELGQTNEQRLLFDATDSTTEFQRPYAVPPGVPAERVRALGEAFMASLRDPELLQQAEKAQHAIDPRSGEELERAVQEYFSLPPELAEKLRTILTP